MIIFKRRDIIVCYFLKEKSMKKSLVLTLAAAMLGTAAFACD